MAVVEQHGDGAGVGVCGRQVHAAVAVQVAHRDRGGIGAERIDVTGLERPVAVVRQDCDGSRAADVLVGRCDDEVRRPVAVHVPDGDRGRSRSRRVVALRAEAAVARVDEHGDRAPDAVSLVAGHEVRLPIAVDVGDRERARPGGGRVVASRQEAPVARVQEDRDVVAETVRRRDVEPGVAVQVADLERGRGEIGLQAQRGGEGREQRDERDSGDGAARRQKHGDRQQPARQTGADPSAACGSSSHARAFGLLTLPDQRRYSQRQVPIGPCSRNRCRPYGTVPAISERYRGSDSRT